MVEIDFQKIEEKWQRKWEESKIFEVKENSKKLKKYILEMFPYPSGSGLHIGHAWNFLIGDILARFYRMKGLEVLHPMGFDSLGLPAENAAIKDKIHPKDYTNKSISNFIKQQKMMGLSYDWSRKVVTSDPSYYKWDQWIFLKMFEKGLAYQKESNVNWCPSCKTVLANEQAQTGKCDRCGTKVEIKYLKQWFLKIMNYADELYEEINNLKNWPERTKAMQRNWIGKSYGTEIDFEIETPSEISNVVIVHGSADDEKDNQYNKHWMLWIKEKLEKEKIKVFFPKMPEPWGSTYSAWKNEFEKFSGLINEDSVLIGHSRGTAFLVRWLGETRRKIKKLILVAPWKFADNPSKENFYNFKINKDIKNNFQNLIIFTSDDEEDLGKKSLIEYKNSLGGKIIELRNHGHFIFDDMKTEEFPELLNEILNKNKFPIFTTRPDTIFGVTFMVISAQHPKLFDIVTKEQKKSVELFLKRLKTVSEKDLADMEKEGIFTGSYAINPMTKEKIPVYVGNFVVADYGSGMVMAVPAHDQRDFEFAKKYGIKIRQVIEGTITNNRAYVDEGKLINSEQFNGLNNEEAKRKITSWLEKKKIGRKIVNFRLRDWGISRQRYWGTPIPIIHCERCGIVPVKEKDLPVELPGKVEFGEGNPLETNEKWVNVKCPECGGKARRETDTMDTFVNSSWYFMRYCDPKNDKLIFDKKKVSQWCPVNNYIGGSEHACMHLIYARFYTKFLADLGLIKFREPFEDLFHQGFIYGEDGEKMSKSRGNTVDPLDTIKKYGTDTMRFFLISMASPDKDFNWSEKGILGSLRFINKVFETFEEIKFEKDSEKLEIKLNSTIKNVSNYYENFNYRKATIEIRELFDLIFEEKICSKKTFEFALKLLSPICPHITEELWEKLKNKSFISTEKWPNYDKNKLKISEKEVNLNDKIFDMINPILSKADYRNIFLYVVPSELNKVDVKSLKEKFGKEVKVYSVSNPNKIDPQGKSKKAKLGVPSFYLE